MVVVVFGLPGSGKSYFASRLAAEFDAHHINSDEVRIELEKQGQYNNEIRETIYNTMMQQASLLLDAGRIVVLDATFYKESLRKKAIDLAGEKGVDILFIEIIAGRNLVRKRLERKRETSEADYRVHLLIKRLFEPMEEPHLILESKAANIEDMLDEAIPFVKGGNYG